MTPIPYWMDGAADVAETTYTPFQTKPDGAPVRLIVRRVKPTARFPARPLRQIQLSRLSSRGPRWGDAGTGRPIHRFATPRSTNAIRDRSSTMRPGLNHMPSARFAANGAWLAVQVLAHNLDRLDGADWSGRADRDHQDLSGGGSCRSGGTRSQSSAMPPSLCISPGAGPPGKPSSVATSWPGCKPVPFPA